MGFSFIHVLWIYLFAGLLHIDTGCSTIYNHMDNHSEIIRQLWNESNISKSYDINNISKYRTKRNDAAINESSTYDAAFNGNSPEDAAFNGNFLDDAAFNGNSPYAAFDGNSPYARFIMKEDSGLVISETLLDVNYMSYHNVTIPMCYQDLGLNNRMTCYIPPPCGEYCQFSGCCLHPKQINSACAKAGNEYIDINNDKQLYINASIQEFAITLQEIRGALLQRKKCVDTGPMYMITDYIDNQDRLQECPELSYDNIVRTFYPVYDLHNDQVVFKNAICAELNGYRKTEYALTHIEFHCPESTQPGDINFKFVLENCKAIYYGGQNCIPRMIDHCPFDNDYRFGADALNISPRVAFMRDSDDVFTLELSSRNTSDQFNIATLCSALKMHMYDEVNDIIYKNGFCALCNGLDNDYILNNLTCVTLEKDIGDPVDFLPRFSLLVDEDRESVEGWFYNEQEICTGNAFFMVDEQTCVSGQCSVLEENSLNESHCMLQQNDGIPQNPIVINKHLDNNNYVTVTGNQTLMLQLQLTAAVSRKLSYSFIREASIDLELTELFYYNVMFISTSIQPCTDIEITLSQSDDTSLNADHLYCVVFIYDFEFDPNNIESLDIFQNTLANENLGRFLELILGDLYFLVQTVGIPNYKTECEGGRVNLKQFNKMQFVARPVLNGFVSSTDMNVLIPELNAIFPFDRILFQYVSNLQVISQNSQGSFSSNVRPTAHICKTHILVCDSVLIHDYDDIKSNGSKITLSLTSKYECVLELVLGEDILIFSNGDIQICASNLCPTPLTLEYILNVTDSIVNIIGGFLSMIAYIATLIVYMILPRLQNIPGKCVMFLVIFMLIGHLCLLLSPLISQYNMVCFVIGVVQHYAWISCMCWMFCMSLDLALTFGTWSGSLFQSSKRFQRFCIFSFVLPLAIVLVYTPFVLMDIGGFGYGGNNICWLYPNEALLYFFIVPIVLILAVNHILFVPTAYGILKQKQVSQQVSNTEVTQAIAQNLRSLGKILFLDGIIWVLALFAYAFDSGALKMIFSILASFQGVFLFISFAVTARVRQLWTARGTQTS